MLNDHHESLREDTQRRQKVASVSPSLPIAQRSPRGRAQRETRKDEVYFPTVSTICNDARGPRFPQKLLRPTGKQDIRNNTINSNLACYINTRALPASCDPCELRFGMADRRKCDSCQNKATGLFRDRGSTTATTSTTEHAQCQQQKLQSVPL